MTSSKTIKKLCGGLFGAFLLFGSLVGLGSTAVKSAVRADAAASTGTINFGSASGSTAVSDTSISGDDSLGNAWTITTVTSSKSFTQNASYSQIGSSNKPATSITATTTLSSSQTITAFSAKFGGYSGTAGSITLKVGDTTVGTGSLNATSDVTVNASDTTKSGTVLTVTVTGISKGVKFYYVSYSYESGPIKTATTTTISAAGSKTTLNVTASPADSVVLTPTISYTGGTISSSVTWTSSDTTVATVSSASGTTTTVTAVGKGVTTITASYAGDSTYKASNGTITITVVNPNEKTYSLKFDDGIVKSTDWSNGYATHKHSYSETGIGTLNFSFESASKQTSTITEYPVGKDGAVEMVLTSQNYYIKDVTFNGVKWGTKAQTMTINYSTDGGTNYTSTGVSSSTFTATKTGLTVGTNAIKITFSDSSNQIGHKSFEVVYAEKPVLSSVTTSGQKTSFDYGEGFSYGGTLTAHYTAGKADATKTPTAYKFGAYDINPDSAGTSITIDTTLTDTHNGEYIYVGYTEDGVTKWASYQISVGAAPSYYMTLSVETDTGTNYGYKGEVVEVDVTASNLAGNIVWTVTDGSVTDATSDNTGYKATITSVGTLTITATDSGDNTNTQSVSIIVVDKLNSVMAAAETAHASTLTFTAAADGSGTADDDATWTVTSDAEEQAYEAARGIHFGTNKTAEVQYVQLVSSDVASGSSNTIRSVVVNTTDAAGTADLTVTVGSTSFKCGGKTSTTVSSVQSEYTFTGTGSGTVIVRVDRGRAAYKGIYVKSVVVNYVTAGEESEIANATDMHLAQKAVIDYAKDFNDKLKDICIAYGSTDTSDLKDAWDGLATQYTNWFTNTEKSLTKSEKEHAKALFANARSADRKFTASADELQHMLAKYDWIVGHYSNCGDFLNTDAGTGRDAVPQANGRVILNTIIGNGNTVAIIVAISMISVTCIGGYFFLNKKRKHN